MTAVLAGLLLALALLSGCTGDGSDDNGGGPGDASGSGARVETNAAIGRVAGKLGKRRRQWVLTGVTDVVDGWIDKAYVEGDYPRGNFSKSFPGFTNGATQLAWRQRRVMSNAGVGPRVEQVDVVKRVVRVDVLAPKGRPAGVTARVVLVLRLSGDLERTDRIGGRLILTPTKNGWKVFGFDVRRKPFKGKR